MWLVLGPSALARATTFSWDMPTGFTDAAPGANPDSDSYGGHPWSYAEGPACAKVPVVGSCLQPPSGDPTQATPLPTFGLHGTSTGWTDPADSDAFVGVDPAASGELLMTAPADRSVVLSWQSPLAHGTALTAGLTITSRASVPCFSWALDQGSQPVASGSGPTPTRTASFAVASGGSVFVTLTRTGASAACATAGLALHLAETEPGGPTVGLGSPPPGSIYTSGQPTFSGLASIGSAVRDTVTVRVYGGNAAAGPPMQTMSAPRGGDGSFSAAAPSGLGDGTYTAQAEQDDAAGDRGLSPPVTFSVYAASSTITLNAIGPHPLLTATPALTGTAGTAPGDSASVTVAVYAGTSTVGTPIRYASATRAADGAFSAKITPALPDGQYTAIAGQSGTQTGVSNPVSFRIKVNPPALTLTAPAPGAHLASTQPTFRGAAGDELGDSGRVAVTLHAGDSPTGRSLGTRGTHVSAGTWSLPWPTRLPPGTYTLVVLQDDDAGHSTTVESTFVIVPPPSVIGSAVALHGATVSLSITCTAPAGTACAGTVLALTTRSLRPRTGGPSGPVRVIFAYVRLLPGHTEVVRAVLPGFLASALRRTPHLEVRVLANLTGVGRTIAVRPLVT